MRIRLECKSPRLHQKANKGVSCALFSYKKFSHAQKCAPFLFYSKEHNLQPVFTFWFVDLLGEKVGNAPSLHVSTKKRIRAYLAPFFHIKSLVELATDSCLLMMAARDII